MDELRIEDVARSAGWIGTQFSNQSSPGTFYAVGTQTSQNHAPAGTDGTINTSENTPYVFNDSDFGFTDPSDSTPNALAAVKISTLPVDGALTFSGTPVTTGQSVAVADLNAGSLQFTPAAHANDADGTAAEPPSAQDQLGTVLKEGTLDEMRLLRQVIGTLYRQITTRRRSAQMGRTRSPAVFEGRPRLLPALGYVPAGVPQGGIEQIANQFIAVPADEFPDAEFALKVQGDSMVDVNIHHGDWVLLDRRREPRDGNVVAALCDNETTLKTYLTDSARGPFLRSENRAYPARIIPREEMQVQGVMVGKISGHGEEVEKEAEPAPF